MSYVDQGGRIRPTSVAAVVLVHAVIGYAVISGLAMQMVRYVDPPIQADLLPADAPPPPKFLPPPPPRTPTAVPQTTQADRIVDVPTTTGGLDYSQIPAEP